MVVQMSDLQLHTYTINGTCLCSVDAGECIHDMKITGEVIVSGGTSGRCLIRSLTTLRVLSGMDLSRHGPIRCISFTADDLPIPQHMFIGSDDGMISIVEHD
jgi:WD40 repeat protein